MPPPNHHIVGIRGDEIIIMKPPMKPLSRRQALELAAWLVVVADPDGDEFNAVLEEILGGA